jgi:tetratricopeptide (TPR) repeat protein
MLKPNLLRRFTWIAILFLCVFAGGPARIAAQTGNDLEELKRQVIKLIDEVKYTEALPLLEKIVAAEPQNARMQFYLGFALTANALQLKDESAGRALRVRARAAFVKAKELGIDEPIIDGLIQSIPSDGSSSRSYSSNVEANALMMVAEADFAKGKLDDAFSKYQRALKLDPKLYHAALFSGDVYTHREDFAQAEAWYQKAIAINPMIETAYRYSATPLMKQGKTQEARDRYIEAFITEPYSKFALAGLIRWAEHTKTPMAHPPIEIPTSVTFDDKGDAKINLSPEGLKGKDDGSFAWVGYGLQRTLWRKEKFAKTYPNETAYRHSLAEEADALRIVVTMASTNKEVKTLSPSLSLLKKLNDDGLLEPYILLARLNEEISKDYYQYLQANRAKLIRYMKEYVVGRTGK